MRAYIRLIPVCFVALTFAGCGGGDNNHYKSTSDQRDGGQGSETVSLSDVDQDTPPTRLDTIEDGRTDQLNEIGRDVIEILEVEDSLDTLEIDIPDVNPLACASDKDCLGMFEPLGVCRAPRCNPQGLCEPGLAQDGTYCELEDPCLASSECQGGVCVPADPRDCDDLNPCTEDSCDPYAGCVHEKIQAACDDGDLCTVGDECLDGHCFGYPVCNDNNPCTLDTCLLPDSDHCQFVPLTGTPCDDYDSCTTLDLCHQGVCTGEGNKCSQCGDGECTLAYETCSSCPEDCGECTYFCGDDLCSPEEGCHSCPEDCGECPVACGDGACEPNLESCVSCSLDCGECEGSCCLAKETAGCQAPGIQACVCAADPFCCEVKWDANCAARSDLCGGCDGSCCEERDQPGCEDEDVEACVCAQDSYCCIAAWDDLCIQEVSSLGCGQCAGTCGNSVCEGSETEFSCPQDCFDSGCQVSEAPGCHGCPCEPCVCSYDPYCCEVEWDWACTFHCQTTCGPDSQGCQESPDPGCGEFCGCEACVCELDPFCCTNKWDLSCADKCENDCSGCYGCE